MGARDHCKRTCRHSYNESISVSQRKTQELNKTLSKRWRLLSLYPKEGPRVAGGGQGGVHHLGQHGTRANSPKDSVATT